MLLKPQLNVEETKFLIIMFASSANRFGFDGSDHLYKVRRTRDPVLYPEVRRVVFWPILKK